MLLPIHGRPRRNNGFTLLELLVAVGVIMVMVGWIVANYNNYNENQRVRQTALQIKTHLRFAQTKALSSEKPTNGCTRLLGYEISFTATTYEIQARCSEGLVGSPISYTVPVNITLSLSPSVPLLFRVLSRGIDISSPVTITVIGPVRNYRLVVSPSGDISDYGFL